VGDDRGVQSSLFKQCKN